MTLKPAIGSNVIEFEQVDSTNDYAMQLANEGNAEHGTTIIAQFQTKGKGQQGRIWQANKEKNLLLSVILDTSQKDIQSQFILNAAFCSALAHLLMEDYEIGDVSIKWPNDLYVRKKKVAGILIENVIRGQQWQYSIVGIGLNVNQINFPPEMMASSIKNEMGNEIDISNVRKKLFIQINKAYKQYVSNELDLIAEYNSLLHGYNSKISFIKEGKTYTGQLHGAQQNGLLCIDDEQYRHGEIKLLL